MPPRNQGLPAIEITPSTWDQLPSFLRASSVVSAPTPQAGPPRCDQIELGQASSRSPLGAQPLPSKRSTLPDVAAASVASTMAGSPEGSANSAVKRGGLR